LIPFIGRGTSEDISKVEMMLALPGYHVIMFQKFTWRVMTTMPKCRLNDTNMTGLDIPNRNEQSELNLAKKLTGKRTFVRLRLDQDNLVEIL
jgi:hypothetical protein